MNTIVGIAGAAVAALQLPKVARLKLNPSQIPTVSMNCLESTVSPFPASLSIMDKYHQIAKDCPVLVISNDQEINCTGTNLEVDPLLLLRRESVLKMGVS